MNIAMKLMSQFSSNREKAYRAVCAVARKDAAGELKSLPQDLANSLTLAEIRPKDYAELVGFYKDLVLVEQGAAALPDAEAAHLKAKHDLEAFDAETERLKKERAEERLQMVSRMQEHDAMIRRARRAVWALQIYQYRNPIESGLQEPVDITRITPTRNGEPAGHRDPAAPLHEVPEEDFLRESARRSGILKSLEQTMQAEHRAAVDAWAAEKRKHWNDDNWLKKHPGPAYALPTWADAIKRGLNK